jgi:hypothetical protein
MHRHAIHIGGRSFHKQSVVGNGLGGSVLLNKEGQGNIGSTLETPSLGFGLEMPSKMRMHGGVLGDANLGEKLGKLVVRPLVSKKPANISF